MKIFEVRSIMSSIILSIFMYACKKEKLPNIPITCEKKICTKSSLFILVSFAEDSSPPCNILSIQAACKLLITL